MEKLYFVQVKMDNTWGAVRAGFKTEGHAANYLRRLVGKSKRENLGLTYRIFEKEV